MYSIAIDPTLAREAQDVFSGHGIDLGDAVSTFLRKSIRDMKSADAMTEEELMAKQACSQSSEFFKSKKPKIRNHQTLKI